MVSTYTTNKKIEQPANNDYVGNWNLPVNADWSTIDTCFGGYQVLNPTGLSGVVVLTSSTSGTQPYTTTAQWQAPNIVIGTSLSGVATLTANVNYQLPSGIGGIWSIYNNTTGAFTVTFSSAGGGSSVVLPQGYRIKVVSDGTNVQVAQTSSTNFGLSGALRFLGSTTGYMGFQGPATGNNTVWTLPGTDGSAGQVLSTNGSAVLSWASVPALASALTAGSVLFGNASGQIAQDNAKLYWDDTNYRLGVGTSSPATSMHVQQSVDGEIFRVQRSGGTNIPILQFILNETNNLATISETGTTAGAIAFQTGGSERMRILAAGNVSIGASTAGGWFNAQGYSSYRGDGYTVASFAANSTLAPLNIVQNNNNTYPGIAAGQNSSAAFQPLAFLTSDTERMTITAGGSVGIGNTSPSYTLDVTGNMRATNTGTFGADGTNGYTYIAQGSSTVTGYIGFYSGATVRNGYVGNGTGAGGTLALWNDLSASLVFGTNGTERMRITAAGLVGIGNYPSNILTVTGTGSTAWSYFAGNVGASNPPAGATFGVLLGANYSNVSSEGNIAYSNFLTFASWNGTTYTERLRIAASGEFYMAAAQSPTQTYDVGYLGIPQVGNAAKTGNYTAALADAGQQILFNATGLTGTIPANGSVAYPIGTTLTFINIFAGNLSIAITTDTMTLANSTTTGTRTLAQNGVATAVKYTATSWIISGVGLT